MRPVVGALLLAVVAGCGRDEPAPAPAKPLPVPVEIMAAPPEGEVPTIVQREFARAKDERRTLLVYVGATWCEPCKRFHDAAAAGQLDATFPGLRLVEFDLDRDHDRLERAGYASRMIPLFAVPRADGTGSGQQIEGSIKGEGAVNQIAPRLSALLAKANR
jgi:thiol-disulfide isomerase/thioredoxin